MAAPPPGTPRTETRWWIAGGAAVLLLDLLLATNVTGLLALATMVFGLVWLGSRVRGVEWVGFFLTAAFAVARGYLVYRGFFRPGDTPDPGAARTYDLVFVAGLAALALAATRRRAVRVWTARLVRRPARVLVASFGILIALATLLLVLPVSLVRVTDVSLLDALFTATSAVSVTGLVVNDVAATYSWFGQLVLLVCIQLGGIGIMTVAALAAVLRREGPLRDQARYAAVLQTGRLRDLRRTVLGIVVATLTIEAIGAGLLLLLWSNEPRLAGQPVVWAAIFHAVSAFCNAGFALWPTSLAPFSESPAVLAVIMGLITIGGLGFPVLLLLFRRDRSGLAAARVAVTTSLILVVVGAAAFSVLESGRTLRDLPLVDRLVNAVFASVTSRTAGFATVDVAGMTQAALLVTMALMFVGGSPGSTAGGIKTTTAAVLFAALRGELRGREPVLGRRAVPPETIRRAAAVLTLSVAAVFTIILLLAITESHPFSALAFEAVSAFATTGLSTGITASLSAAGKTIILVAMFVGRVGPITVAIAVGDRFAPAPHRLPPEDLPIG